MGAAKKTRNNNASGNGGNATPRKKRNHAGNAATIAQADIGVEQVKHLLRAPSGYPEIARQFASGLEQTNFRGAISPRRIRTQLARGERLTRQAADAQVKATAAARKRMLHDSQLWKSIMATWRMIVAAMPDHPELEQPFAFMQEYMSTSRSKPAPPPTPPVTT
ncbi:MAG TPA: hypothetical protein VN812_22630 [Candidatus Acidoferrales bacterium]|nr:hypothetical protein [Candidatus Acidoferrales bacterium]